MWRKRWGEHPRITWKWINRVLHSCLPPNEVPFFLENCCGYRDVLWIGIQRTISGHLTPHSRLSRRKLLSAKSLSEECVAGRRRRSDQLDDPTWHPWSSVRKVVYLPCILVTSALGGIVWHLPCVHMDAARRAHLYQVKYVVRDLVFKTGWFHPGCFFTAMTLTSRGGKESSADITELGSMLFTRNVSGTRCFIYWVQGTKRICFSGLHSEAGKMPRLNSPHKGYKQWW